MIVRGMGTKMYFCAMRAMQNGLSAARRKRMNPGVGYTNCQSVYPGMFSDYEAVTN
jgi:hypothetical protein